MILYHGSYTRIPVPKLLDNGRTKDFGISSIQRCGGTGGS